MKTITSALALSLLSATSALAAVDLKLDFTQVGGVYTAGWDPVYANFLADTPTANINNIDGLGYSFSFNHVAVYDNGHEDESLTRSGFYTFSNEQNDHTFTLTGLNTGDTVSLYACAAWDGNGRGGYVVFGNSGAAGVQAQTLGDPGLAPTLDNLTFIGSATADSSGVLQGTLSGSGGVGSATEGQVGGFILEITPAAVPEPATLALFAFGAGLFVVSRRRA